MSNLKKEDKLIKEGLLKIKKKKKKVELTKF